MYNKDMKADHQEQQSGEAKHNQAIPPGSAGQIHSETDILEDNWKANT